ncbi:MAG: hypothetical protein AVDCRST_MAG69-1104, partial [uncultured Solirubrobacteraceae bacterium]
AERRRLGPAARRSAGRLDRPGRAPAAPERAADPDGSAS